MNSLTQGDGGSQDVLLYGRNSTDDQAEAGTIENQQGFLRNYLELYRLNLVGEFWDEGVSGTVPLEERPQGRRLLEAARTRPGAAVLCYRLDRMGRSLRSLLDAHADLEAAGVTIKSATEPFDTSTSIGKFLFQLLGNLAELERSTIAERTMLGRDRVARAGKWTGHLRFGQHRTREEIASPQLPRAAAAYLVALRRRRCPEQPPRQGCHGATVDPSRPTHTHLVPSRTRRRA